ncbi:MAG TPA: RNA 2',3'-cyclic phosphodiesterase [Candidatus Obscuribacterales bacterium]
MSSSCPQKRLFVGTFLSADQQKLLGELNRYGERLTAAWGCRLRWVKPAKLHMTWLFLGSVNPELISQIRARLGGIAAEHRSMAVAYDRLEFWPDARRPRQLVMTPAAVPEPVGPLAASVRSQLKEFTAKPDERAFRPHLTLLRFDRGSSSARAAGAPARLAVPEWLDTSGFLPLVHRIGEIALIESHLGKGADEYEMLACFPLGG